MNTVTTWFYSNFNGAWELIGEYTETGMALPALREHKRRHPRLTHKVVFGDGSYTEWPPTA